MGEILPARNNEFYMLRAIALAFQAKGKTAPNPMVGAVIVGPNGEIIGQGFHSRAGEAHAEVRAINDALQKQKDLSTCRLFVTLEPCNHFGRTPPCVDLILKNGIKMVIAGALDPNPLMMGKSLEALKKAGVEVTVGVCKSECEKLIRGFKATLNLSRPFVSLKCAASLDGKLATRTGESKWITGVEARQYAHQLRAEHDAILVGVGTIQADNPSLDPRPATAMKVKSEQDLLRKKIILDSRLVTPLDARVFDSPGGVIIYCEKTYPDTKKARLEARGAKVVSVEKSQTHPACLDLSSVLRDLALNQGVQDVLVEGGATVLGSFMRENIFDQLYYFVAPKIIGSGGREVFAGFEVSNLKDSELLTDLKVKTMGKDFVLEGARSCSPV